MLLDEFITTNGRFVALSPKNYFCYNAETNSKKTAYKGIDAVTNLVPVNIIVWYQCSNTYL